MKFLRKMCARGLLFPQKPLPQLSNKLSLMPVFMFVCVCVCVCACEYVCGRVCVCACMYACVSVHVKVHVLVCFRCILSLLFLYSED